jgi:hypothetical protein
VKTSSTLQPKAEISPFNVSDIGLCFYDKHFLALHEKIKFFEFPQISGMNQSISVYLLVTHSWNSVSEMAEQTSGLSSPHQHKEKLYICICLQLLNVPPQQHVDLSTSVFFFFFFLSVGSLKNSNSIENRRDFTIAFLRHIKPFGTALGPLKWCDVSWSDMSMDALVHWFRWRTFGALLWIVTW